MDAIKGAFRSDRLSLTTPLNDEECDDPVHRATEPALRPINRRVALTRMMERIMDAIKGASQERAAGPSHATQTLKEHDNHIRRATEPACNEGIGDLAPDSFRSALWLINRRVALTRCFMRLWLIGSAFWSAIAVFLLTTTSQPDEIAIMMFLAPVLVLLLIVGLSWSFAVFDNTSAPHSVDKTRRDYVASFSFAGFYTSAALGIVLIPLAMQWYQSNEDSAQQSDQPAEVTVGTVLGGETGRPLDPADQIAAEAINRALEHTTTGASTPWRDQASGYHGTVSPTRTYEIASKRDCRDYELKVYNEGGAEMLFTRTACRQPDGTWHDEQTVRDDQGEPASAGRAGAATPTERPSQANITAPSSEREHAIEHHFSVLGEVKDPGRKLLTSDAVDYEEAIKIHGGGFTADACHQKVTIKRTDGTMVELTPRMYQDLVINGDTITVHRC